MKKSTNVPSLQQFSQLKTQGKLRTVSKQEWTQFLEQAAQEKDLKQSIELFKAMKSNGLQPDASCYVHLLESAQYKVSHLMAIHETVFKEALRQKETSSLSDEYVLKLITLLSSHHRPGWKMIGEVWKDVTSTPVYLSTETLIVFLKGFAQLQDDAKVIKVHEILSKRKNKEKWSSKVFEALLGAHLKLGKYKKVYQMYNSMDFGVQGPSLYFLVNLVKLFDWC